METKFKSTGFVYGNFWGGGQGAYPARKLTGDTRGSIILQAKQGLDGSLDAGMGYESLIGAMLSIEKITTVIIDGLEFTNSEYEMVFVGKLTKKQKDHLLDCRL